MNLESLHAQNRKYEARGREMIVMNSFRTCEDENYGEARLGTN
jgi:hypothetical protein